MKVIAVVAAALLPLGAAAQKNIDSAISTFGSNIGKYGVYRQINDKSPKGAYCTRFEFRLPKSEEKKLAFLEKAFYQDVSEAYDVFIKKADDTSKSNRLITYGDNLEKSLSLGWPGHKSGRNYLFMFVRSKDDANFRYVYGLELHYSGKHVEGAVVKIYSLDPKRVKQDRSLLPKGDLADYMSAAGDLASLQSDLEELKELVKLKKQEPVQTTDPIQQFSNLRVAYLNSLRMTKGSGVSTVLTGLANSILDLCKKKSAQMSVAEKRLCAEGLKEMQQATPDNYIKGIFGVAQSVLDKYGELDDNTEK